ncbi:ribosomal protein S8 [Luteibacter jiangsuensis]|uniref:Ribosomal protein S8 n=1 Tax=Luteibacter jiangsuensis TaxID=637577 RepID=A0ABT9SUD9_9GAMM|nr:hypothetical protein [Luteibacter jiangsuensis]MDQ0008169.1 ribosomal protein S8 [Luteibacter jiangsuensis]
MSDTIELLEAIGRDASLRHISAEELADLLRRVQASEALTKTVVSGDRSWLSEEFGTILMHTTHISQIPAHEDDEDEDDKPDHDEDGKEHENESPCPPAEQP